MWPVHDIICRRVTRVRVWCFSTAVSGNAGYFGQRTPSPPLTLYFLVVHKTLSVLLTGKYLAF